MRRRLHQMQELVDIPHPVRQNGFRRLRRLKPHNVSGPINLGVDSPVAHHAGNFLVDTEAALNGLKVDVGIIRNRNGAISGTMEVKQPKRQKGRKVTPSIVTGLQTSSKMRSLRINAASISGTGSATTTNSSPPRRPARSPSLILSRRRSEIVCNITSPVWCP
eukprot:scaffold91542_cov48-Attheya_sp.AAC.7